MKHWILKFLIELGKWILTWGILWGAYYLSENFDLFYRTVFDYKPELKVCVYPILITLAFGIGYLFRKKEDKKKFFKRYFSFVVYALLFSLIGNISLAKVKVQYDRRILNQIDNLKKLINTNILMRDMPLDSEASGTDNAWGVLKYHNRDPEKMCAKRGEFAEPLRPCRDWEKQYDNGSLVYYREYGYVRYRGDEYGDEFITYSVTFHPDGTVKEIGDKNGVQYYDKNGRLVKVCDGFYEGLIGSRMCLKYDEENDEWKKAPENWIT